MPTIFVKQGNVVSIREAVTDGLIDHVPAAIYSLSFDKHGTPLLEEKRKSFGVEKNTPYFYGKHRKHLDTLVSNYNRINGSTGVILCGKAGSGKSLLAEHLCDRLLTMGVPVILITDAFRPEPLEDVVRKVGPCVVYFDEFGKVYYDEEQRQRMLTLFSASGLNKVQFIVTGNEYQEFSPHMLDRPGRFEYRINFRGLTHAVVDEVLERHNVNPTFISMLTTYGRYSHCSIDVFRHVVSAVQGCETIDDAIELIDIMNVPRLPTKSVHAFWKNVEDVTANISASLSKEGDKVTVEFTTKMGYDADAETVVFNLAEAELLCTDEEDNQTYLWRHQGREFYIANSWTNPSQVRNEFITDRLFHATEEKIRDIVLSNNNQPMATPVNPFKFQNHGLYGAVGCGNTTHHNL